MNKTLVGNLKALVNQRPKKINGTVKERLTTIKMSEYVYGIYYFETNHQIKDKFDCLSMLNFKIVLINKK